MDRVVFVDDDPSELRAFVTMVNRSFDCVTVQWPEESEKLFGDHAPPGVFVSDLYLPTLTGDRVPTPTDRDEVARAASGAAKAFEEISLDQSVGDKERLRRTMAAILEAYKMLDLQVRALGQSPQNGINLLTRLRDKYPTVPVIFYSRKITPEDVTSVLRAGAVDAMRKGMVDQKELVSRIASAVRGAAFCFKEAVC